MPAFVYEYSYGRYDTRECYVTHAHLIEACAMRLLSRRKPQTRAVGITIAFRPQMECEPTIARGNYFIVLSILVLPIISSKRDAHCANQSQPDRRRRRRRRSCDMPQRN